MVWALVGDYTIDSLWLSWFFTDPFSSEWVRFSHSYNQKILGLKILMAVSDFNNNDIITNSRIIYPRQDKKEVIKIPDYPFINNKVVGFYAFYYWESLAWSIKVEEWI